MSFLNVSDVASWLLYLTLFTFSWLSFTVFMCTMMLCVMVCSTATHVSIMNHKATVGPLPFNLTRLVESRGRVSSRKSAPMLMLLSVRSGRPQ